MFDRIRAWYQAGRWTAGQVQAAADRGWISQQQAADILTEPPA